MSFGNPEKTPGSLSYFVGFTTAIDGIRLMVTLPSDGFPWNFTEAQVDAAIAETRQALLDAGFTVQDVGKTYVVQETYTA